MLEQSRKKKAGLVGRFIQKRRQELNLTRAELAKRLRCTVNMICQVENGVVWFPTKNWLSYANALEVPEHQVLELALEERFPDMLPFIRFYQESLDKY